MLLLFLENNICFHLVKKIILIIKFVARFSVCYKKKLVITKKKSIYIKHLYKCNYKLHIIKGIESN